MRKLLYPLTFIIFILIQNPYIKLFLAIFYMIICFIRGMRVRAINSILLMATIVLLSGLNPHGEVILDLSFYKLTVDSLNKGVYKGSLLIGSLYLSKMITSGTIFLPGSIGNFIGRVFYYFNQLSAPRSIKINNLINELDKSLMNLNHNFESVDKKAPLKSPLSPLIISLLLYLLDIELQYNILF